MGRTGRVHALGARADVQYGVARRSCSALLRRASAASGQRPVKPSYGAPKRLRREYLDKNMEYV